MYGLVPYNISPIQQAIQYGHALQEYNNILFDMKMTRSGTVGQHEAFDTWRKECKTFIILNGGTTNDSEEYTGTMNTHLQMMEDMKWPFASFREPDLGNQITAIVFIVPEQVYNRKLYPDFWEWAPVKEKFDKKDLDKFKGGVWDWETSFSSDEVARGLMIAYMAWVNDVMGSNENDNMRRWVSPFRLA
jgi:hypothetical protein